MDTKIAIFWVDFADKYADDERAATAIARIARVPVGAARETIAAGRAHLADPLFNLTTAREIVRHIAEQAEHLSGN